MTLEKRFPQGRRPSGPLLAHDQHRAAPSPRSSPSARRTSWRSRRRSSRVFQRYRERKRAANACDYDDLLLSWKRLLDESPGGRRGAPAASYDHVLVDEYQDTNRLQGEIVDGMAQHQPQRDGRGRRRPGDLLLPRRLVREHPRLSPSAIPDAQDVPPDAELPLDARDPGARQRVDRQQPAAVSRRTCARARGGGRAPAGRPAARHSGPGPLRGAAAAGVARRRRKALGPRGALPRALPGARAADRADAPRHSLRDPLRHALLRAAARQGRARVSAARS